MGEADDADSGDDSRPDSGHGGRATEDDCVTSDGTGPRRRFLRLLGAASALAGTAGVGVAQETTTDDGDRTTGTTTNGASATTGTTAADDATPVVLGGRTDYWLGLSPDAMEGQQNPTLDLRPGERYRLVWVNLDGQRHRWQVETGDGSVVERTEATRRVGATRSVTFEATEEMARYRCEFHPDAMRGSVGPAGTTTAGETTGEPADETAAEETTPKETTAEGTTGEETTAAGDGEVVDVAVGPEGQYLRFVPEEVEISVGDTVRWTAESEGHNVSAKPEAARQVELPDGVEPFATYEGSRSFMVMQVGDTYEHTFEVPGTYVYVCVPHAGQGMIGRVIVSE